MESQGFEQVSLSPDTYNLGKAFIAALFEKNEAQGKKLGKFLTEAIASHGIPGDSLFDKLRAVERSTGDEKATFQDHVISSLGYLLLKTSPAELRGQFNPDDENTIAPIVAFHSNIERFSDDELRRFLNQIFVHTERDHSHLVRERQRVNDDVARVFLVDNDELFAAAPVDSRTFHRFGRRFSVGDMRLFPEAFGPKICRTYGMYRDASVFETAVLMDGLDTRIYPNFESLAILKRIRAATNAMDRCHKLLFDEELRSRFPLDRNITVDFSIDPKDGKAMPYYRVQQAEEGRRKRIEDLSLEMFLALQSPRRVLLPGEYPEPISPLTLREFLGELYKLYDDVQYAEAEQLESTWDPDAKTNFQSIVDWVNTYAADSALAKLLNNYQRVHHLDITSQGNDRLSIRIGKNSNLHIRCVYRNKKLSAVSGELWTNTDALYTKLREFKGWVRLPVPMPRARFGISVHPNNVVALEDEEHPLLKRIRFLVGRVLENSDPWKKLCQEKGIGSAEQEIFVEYVTYALLHWFYQIKHHKGGWVDFAEGCAFLNEILNRFTFRDFYEGDVRDVDVRYASAATGDAARAYVPEEPIIRKDIASEIIAAISLLGMKEPFSVRRFSDALSAAKGETAQAGAASRFSHLGIDYESLGVSWTDLACRVPWIIKLLEKRHQGVNREIAMIRENHDDFLKIDRVCREAIENLRPDMSSREAFDLLLPRFHDLILFFQNADAARLKESLIKKISSIEARETRGLYHLSRKNSSGNLEALVDVGRLHTLSRMFLGEYKCDKFERLVRSIRCIRKTSIPRDLWRKWGWTQIGMEVAQNKPSRGRMEVAMDEHFLIFWEKALTVVQHIHALESGDGEMVLRFYRESPDLAKAFICRLMLGHAEHHYLAQLRELDIFDDAQEIQNVWLQSIQEKRSIKAWRSDLRTQDLAPSNEYLERFAGLFAVCGVFDPDDSFGQKVQGVIPELDDIIARTAGARSKKIRQTRIEKGARDLFRDLRNFVPTK